MTLSKKLKDFSKNRQNLTFLPTTMKNYSPTRNGHYLNIRLKETSILKEILPSIKTTFIIYYPTIEKKHYLTIYSTSFFHSDNKIPKNLSYNLKISTHSK